MPKPLKPFECEKCSLFVGRTRVGEPICGSASSAKVNLCKRRQDRNEEEKRTDMLIMIENLAKAVIDLSLLHLDTLRITLKDKQYCESAKQRAEHALHILTKMSEPLPMGVL